KVRNGGWYHDAGECATGERTGPDVADIQAKGKIRQAVTIRERGAVNFRDTVGNDRVGQFATHERSVSNDHEAVSKCHAVDKVPGKRIAPDIRDGVGNDDVGQPETVEERVISNIAKAWWEAHIGESAVCKRRAADLSDALRNRVASLPALRDY